jgi:hypothetical protein
MSEIRGGISDPFGPTWTRLVLPALSVLCISLGMLFADGILSAPAVFAGLALLFLSPLILGRHAPHGARILVEPGRVAIRGAFPLDQTLTPRNVTASSICVTESGVTMALERRDRGRHPIVLDLPNERAAEAVRTALGLSSQGVGTLSWPTLALPFGGLDTWARCVGAIAALVGAGLIVRAGDLTPPREPMIAIGMVLLACMFVAVTVVISRLAQRDRGRVYLSQSGVYVDAGRATKFVGYGEIAKVRVGKTAILCDRHEAEEGDGERAPFVIPTRIVRHLRRGTSPLERRHLAAQIEAAAAKARKGTQTFDAPPAYEWLRLQGRPAEWLQKLDAQAQVLSGGSGYRGSAISEGDLWSSLEDPDAPPDVRAASARMLLRAKGGAVRARIAAVVETVRDPKEEHLLRVAQWPSPDEAMLEDAVEAARAAVGRDATRKT